MTEGVLSFLTDYGDQAVILPTFVVVGAVLLLQRRWLPALAWLVCVGGVLGATLALKLADQACGWTVPALTRLDLVNPSGHTASSAVLWGCGAALLVAGRGRRTVATALLAAVAVAVLVSVTRVMLGAHTLSETVLAGVVGVAGALLFGILASRPAARAGAGRTLLASTTLPILAALLVMAAIHGRHWAVEPTIHGSGVAWIRWMVPACIPSPGSQADRWVERRAFDRP